MTRDFGKTEETNAMADSFVQCILSVGEADNIGEEEGETNDNVP